MRVDSYAQNYFGWMLMMMLIIFRMTLIIMMKKMITNMTIMMMIMRMFMMMMMGMRKVKVWPCKLLTAQGPHRQALV